MTAFAPASHGDMQTLMPHKTRRHHPWLIAIGVVILAVVALGIIGALNQPTTASCTGPTCTRPPSSHPLSPPNRYTSNSYGFSLEYSTSNITPSSTDDSSISWDAQLNDGSEVTWTFQGTSPNGRTAQQIVNDVQQNNFGDATYAYTLPNADLGYTPGYGSIYDFTVAPAGGASVHDRLIIIAAIKRGVAVVFTGMGPYHKSDPASADHPDPADTPLVDLGDFEENLTTVTWPGDQQL